MNITKEKIRQYKSDTPGLTPEQILVVVKVMSLGVEQIKKKPNLI